MTFTVDTNLLVYSSDRSSPFHRRASELVKDFATGPEIFYLFWPVVTGYLRICTHPSIFQNPLPFVEACANVAGLLGRPHVRTPGETDHFWSRFTDTARSTPVSGNLVTDAHIAALMVEHGVATIYSGDRDFKKFDNIRVIDPFDSIMSQ